MKCTQSLSQELSASGGKLVAMKCDVRKEEDILSMMSEVKSQLGGADICVNSAGLNNGSSLLSGTTEKWREMMEVRVRNIVKICIIVPFTCKVRTPVEYAGLSCKGVQVVVLLSIGSTDHSIITIDRLLKAHRNLLL